MRGDFKREVPQVFQDTFREDLLFVLVLLQLFILPKVLIVENYKVATRLGLLDSILGIGAPYMASAFGIFLMRQAFK
jgi:sn-glycerol 3-phosphate transport system permease protein